MSIAAQCPDCCTCPQPVVKYDQCTMNVAPAGYAYGPGDFPGGSGFPAGVIHYRRYEDNRTANGPRGGATGTNTSLEILAYSNDSAGLRVTGCNPQSPSPATVTAATTTINAWRDTCSGSVPATVSGSISFTDSQLRYSRFALVSGTCVLAAADPGLAWTAAWSLSYDSGADVVTSSRPAENSSSVVQTFSQRWTYTDFVAALSGLSFVFPGTFGGSSGGAVLSLASTNDWDLSAIISSLRYRFENAGASTTRPGNGGYRIDWLERFIPATGVSIASVELKARGCYRPSVGLSTSPVPGNNAVAAAQMASDGSVASIRVLAPGDYRPAITFSAAPVGGRRAAAVVTALNPATGGVAAWAITDPGAGYLTAPTVTFSTPATGAGNRAIGTAAIVGGAVTAITLSAAGNYRPAVSLSPAGAASAATAVLDATGRVTGITGGTGGAFLPTFSIIGGGSGSGASITATMDPTGGLASVTLSAGGSNYTSNPRVVVNPPSGLFPSAEAVVHLRCGTETARDLTVAAGGAVAILPAGSPGYYEIAPPSTPGTTSVANVWATCA